MVAGVVVDGLEVEIEHDFLASTDELFMASFRQHDGQMRVYLCPGIAQKNRFAGPTGMAEFLRDALRTGDFSTASFRAYADERLERMRRLRNASMVMAAAMTDDCDNRMARRAKFFELQETEPLMLAMMIGLFGGPENAPPEAFDGHLRELIQAA